MVHQSVLQEQAIASLVTRRDGYYVDATYGRGGHTRGILAQLSPQAHLLVMDQDMAAVAHARVHLAQDARVAVVQDNFVPLADHVSPPIDGILFDLGVSSPQLDEAERGFSFHKKGPLDMRMDQSQCTTARCWLQAASEQEIADTLWQYGEERHSRKIARCIKQALAEDALTTTLELAALVARAVGRRPGKKHPATRTFQALRIQVNQELRVLSEVLHRVCTCMRPGSRLVVISFHSLEDRIVKHFIKNTAGLKLLAKVRPDAEECQANRRARSAMMRVAEVTEER